jgi:CO dehydrogenase maturation factor
VLRSLMQHLILYRDDVIVMDMEAGVEHIGRATTRAVDRLIIVVDPGGRSQVAARRIRRLATDIGINRISIIVNRIRGPEDRALVEKNLSDFDFLGMIPIDEHIAAADREGHRPYENLADAPPEFSQIVEQLLEKQ